MADSRENPKVEKEADKEAEIDELDLDKKLLREQTLVNERESQPRDAGGMPQSPIENLPVEKQPGGNPPLEQRQGSIDAPPRSRDKLEKDTDKHQYRGA